MVQKRFRVGLVTGLLLFCWLGLAQSVVQAAGLSLQTVTQTVTATTAVTTTNALVVAPILLDRYPPQNYLDSVRATIGLTFDRPMSRGSIASALRVEPAFPFRLSVYGATVNIEPRQPLQPGTTYHFTLAGTATDNNGVPLGEEYTWRYHLPTLISTITGPTPNQPDAPLQIYFNYSVQPALAQKALTITPAVDGQWRWNDAGTVFTFTPNAPFAANTEYEIAFQSELRDFGENLFPQPAPQRLNTALPIVTVSPIAAPNFGSGAHPATPIEVTFDRPMNQEQVTAAFQISPTIAGAFTWEENKARFTPDRGYFDPYTEYIVTLAAGIQDATGATVLPAPYTWSFRTSALNPVADFGFGANVQLVDADGRRAIQFQVLEPTLESVAMSLYPLDFAQFRERYTASTQTNWWSYKPIKTEGLEAVTRWQAPTTAPTNTDPNLGMTNARELLLPADLPPGFYILEVSAGYTKAQLFVLLTRAVITLKEARGQAVAWVTDFAGANLADLTVSIYDRDGVLLGEGRTDEQGLFRAALPKDAQPSLAVAHTPGAEADRADIFSIVGFGNQWRTGSGWWGGPPEGAAQDHSVYLYTDRPIYRPGQTLYFKGIVRQDDDAILSLPDAGMSVTVQMRDAKDNVVQTLPLTTNDFGTVNGAFTVAAGAVLGDYAVELVIGQERHRQRFKVEEYRKPDFTVNVTADAPTYVQGGNIQLAVESRYLFDEPVASGQVTVTKFLLQPRNWQDGREGYIWGNSYETPQNGVTDADGRQHFTWPAKRITESGYNQRPDWQGSLAYQDWGLEVTVDDGSHQTVSNFAVVKVYNAAQKVTLDTGGYVKAPLESFTIQAKVTTLDDEPVASKALTLTVDQISWERGVGEKVTNVYSEALITDDQGQATVPMMADQAGYYRVTVNGVDSLENPISYQSWLYVYQAGAAGWFATSEQDLRIAADRTTYNPGEEAQLVIESSFSGPALLTFERGTTRREELIQIQAPLTRLSVPIQVDDAPNIFVTVNAWQPQDTTLTAQTWSSLADRRLRTAKVEIAVPVSNKRLTVTVTADKTTYAPRDEATFAFKVTDENGQPVQAELSAALVDEAIFTLSEEQAGPIFDAFYHKRDHLVHTLDSMAPTRWFSGGGGGGGEVGPGPRSDFPDTAIWLPVLQTDVNGVLTVTVTLPDNLTTWRLTTKAVTAQATQVGEAISKIVTQQPLVVRPLLPRILTAGDQVALSALVHNYSDTAQELAVTLALSDTAQADWLQILADVTQTIQLEPGAAQIVGWTVAATTAGEVDLVFAASGAEVADAVRLPLAIRPVAIPDIQSQVGEFTTTLTTAITMPANALAQSHVTVELNRSIAGSVLSGLEYLTGYPYGCVEQIMSRALPNAVVGRALTALGLDNPALQESLPAQLNAGLQQLSSMQHEDGGWGWWYDDESDSYQTAWVVFGLALTRDSGVAVADDVLNLGVSWLRQNLTEMDPRTRAFALYSIALAGHGDRAATQALIAESDKLDPFSLAALALALHQLGAPTEAEQLVARLVALAQTEAGKSYWPTSDLDGHYAHKVMSSTTRTTALALSALVQITPGSALEPNVVRWLMSQRRQSGWGSTNETAFALLALTDHLRAAQEQATPSDYQVLLNDAEIAQGTLDHEQPQARIEIPLQQLQAGTNQLRIAQSGDGLLYYQINRYSYVAQPEIPAAGVVQVSRIYRDSRTGATLDQLRPGQLVRVELTVALPEDAFYMIVEDKLPGGLEALNTELNTTSRVATAFEQTTFYWRSYGYNNKEVRSDRVSFFITEMKAGRYVYRYLARATHAGEFTALPAEAYAMYDAATWGRSSNQALTVAAE
ncbi:MAG: hypothetical protein DYG89_43710 [Caldilinea sp. CFX5]|nr:hypothetical protein [Caldilinea sp. CFX5]